MIELDRRGTEDAVFYDCENKKFQEFIIGQGFKKDQGTFSDISILSPAWDIASVNLSIGYFNEHTKEEFLFTKATERNLQRVRKILDMNEFLPMYKGENILTSKFAYDTWDFDTVKCHCCHRMIDAYEGIPVIKKDKNKIDVCGDCLAKILKSIEWCDKCGSAFFTKKQSHDILCPICREIK